MTANIFITVRGRSILTFTINRSEEVRVLSDLPSMKMKRRANIAILAGTFAFAALVTMNLFKIMVVQTKFYQKMADEAQFGAQTIPAGRGSIYSSDGKILAQSATAYKIMLDPDTFRKNELKNPYITAHYICEKLGAKKEDVIQAIKKNELSGFLNALPETYTLGEVKSRVAGKPIEELNRDLFSEFLATELGISKTDVLEAMGEDTSCVYLVNKAEKPVKDRIEKYIEDNGISCMRLTPNPKRYYPQDELASSVVGFLNYEGEGQYGIELMYDEYLAGVDGVVITAQDALKEQMPYRYSKLYEAKDGDSVNLTIDSMIQYYCESALDASIADSEAAEYGCAIVMNAKTGAVLGMYSAPGFDINNKGVLSDEDLAILDRQKINPPLSEDDKVTEADLLEKMWKNKAISVINEPGSVFKVFTSSAALEEKTATFDSTYQCGGFVRFGEGPNDVMFCHERTGHGLLSFKDALLNSCNPAFMQIGIDLGAEKFSYYADAFGLREKTGIDLPGEVNGTFVSLYGEDDGLATREITLASSAYGQTNCLTPIQMITGYAAAINGGYLLRPYVVGSIVDSGNNEVMRTEKEIRRQVISESTSALVREALQNNVDSKNKGNAYISGYKIGGKSGTAEKLSKLQREENKYYQLTDENPEAVAVVPKPVKQYVASYCAFAPADNPEIVVYVAVDEPQTDNYYGGSIAAPCVRTIMENVLPYLGYYPEYTDDEILTMDIRVPDVEKMSVNDAIEKLKESGFTPELKGEGETVVSQIPSFTSSMPSGGKVFLFTDPFAEPSYFAMPSLKGMKMQAVSDLFANLGLNLKTTGSQNENAIVLSQSVDENTMVNEGTIVSVHFGINNQTG